MAVRKMRKDYSDYCTFSITGAEPDSAVKTAEP